MDELKIINDPTDTTNFDYTDLVVQQNSDDDIKIELTAKFIPPMEISEPITIFANITTAPISALPLAATTTPAKTPKKPKSKQLIESKLEIVENIICIIHKKVHHELKLMNIFKIFFF